MSNMESFKLKYYFEMYKDKGFINSNQFRRDFVKRHGPFKELSELVVKIYNYQAKKYGGFLDHRVPGRRK